MAMRHRDREKHPILEPEQEADLRDYREYPETDRKGGRQGRW